MQVIERAYSEWQYHAEQARLAAGGVRGRRSGADAASSPDAALHTYHSAQREKAARCIQGFLQRQQLQQGGAGAGADEHQMAPESPPLYSEDQLKCFRRAQSAFSSHVRQQEADAQELHMTMLMGGDVAQLIR